MINNKRASAIPRGMVVPAVMTIWCLAFLLLGATFGVRPWFIHWFDWLDARGVGHADIDEMFRHFSVLASLVLGGVLLLPGAVLLCRKACRAATVLWYGGLAVIALAGWTLWVTLVFHNTYIALFTR
jgi:hypothetical protein